MRVRCGGELLGCVSGQRETGQASLRIRERVDPQPWVGPGAEIEGAQAAAVACFLWAPVFDGELVDTSLVPPHQSRVDTVRVGFVRAETEPGGAVHGVR